MKISLNWLKSYLKLDNYSTDELFDLISKHMTEIEDSYKLVSVNNLVVGEVLECLPHPNSDHLHVCKVKISANEVSQIVCGAPNVRAGQKVIVALPGARFSKDFVIKPTKLRGEESNGMICSLQEIGIEEKYVKEEYKNGIFYFKDDMKVKAGDDPLKALFFDDFVFDLELTSNRSDLLSAEGIAYDLGAVLNQKVKPIEFELKESTTKINQLNVEVKTDKCPKYLTRVIKDVKIAESPLWMQEKLIAVGIRPINNVVDITNYVLIEMGQPLHSFDYDKLGNDIVVRNAVEGETLTTLDDVERKLTKDDIVIANKKNAICVAGVMGGKSTDVDEYTKNVVLEAAYFDPLSVRKTSKRLGLKSESSVRFERKIDFDRVNRALDYAAYLLKEYASGTVCKGVQGLKAKAKKETVEITLEKVNSVLGTNLTKTELKSIFNRYQYEYTEENKVFTITIPTRRMDLEASYQDIIEDVARLYGYDLIPYELAKTDSKGGLTFRQAKIREIREFLAGLGIYEAVTYSLENLEHLDDFSLNEYSNIKVMMPLLDSMSYMRHTLLNGLINTISYNKARKQNDLAFFEIGKRYTNEKEELLLSGAFEGKFMSSDFEGQKTEVNFFLVKGILEALFAKLNVKASYSPIDSKLESMHPGRSAYVKLGDEIIGIIGELNPRYVKVNDLYPCYVFEIDLEKLLAKLDNKFTYKTLPIYPEVTRDIAIIVDKNIFAQEIIDQIKASAKDNLVSANIFDLYEGEKMKKDEKSIAIKLTLIDYNKTLETKEVDEIVDKILKRLEHTLNARLR